MSMFVVVFRVAGSLLGGCVLRIPGVSVCVMFVGVGICFRVSLVGDVCSYVVSVVTAVVSSCVFAFRCRLSLRACLLS